MKNQWSGYLGFLIAVAGAAIGLGNIWKFPYMAGENGGSSFVIIYMLFVFFFGIPLMLAEMIIGKCGGSDPISSFIAITNKIDKGKIYAKFSWILVVTSICILSFYSVVAGFSLAYLYKSILGSFVDLNPQEIKHTWSMLINSPFEIIIWNVLFLLISIIVVIRGIKDGLEKANKILMPALYVILGLLVLYAYSLDGFGQAWNFMFGFRIEQISASDIIAALGHAFFHWQWVLVV
ncbi:MAG: sodium-dependent transporter [Legionellales bacterium]|nr:sodium-dependent transporter [Legionellales bacterium]